MKNFCTYEKPEVGMTVYEVGVPQNPGVIIDVTKWKDWNHCEFTVKWLKPKGKRKDEVTEYKDTWRLNSFDSLVKNTVNKAKRHEDNLKKLQEEVKRYV